LVAFAVYLLLLTISRKVGIDMTSYKGFPIRLFWTGGKRKTLYCHSISATCLL